MLESILNNAINLVCFYNYCQFGLGQILLRHWKFADYRLEYKSVCLHRKIVHDLLIFTSNNIEELKGIRGVPFFPRILAYRFIFKSRIVCLLSIYTRIESLYLHQLYVVKFYRTSIHFLCPKRHSCSNPKVHKVLTGLI